MCVCVNVYPTLHLLALWSCSSLSYGIPRQGESPCLSTAVCVLPNSILYLFFQENGINQFYLFEKYRVGSSHGVLWFWFHRIAYSTVDVPNKRVFCYVGTHFFRDEFQYWVTELISRWPYKYIKVVIKIDLDAHSQSLDVLATLYIFTQARHPPFYSGGSNVGCRAFASQ